MRKPRTRGRLHLCLFDEVLGSAAVADRGGETRRELQNRPARVFLGRFLWSPAPAPPDRRGTDPTLTFIELFSCVPGRRGVHSPG